MRAFSCQCSLVVFFNATCEQPFLPVPNCVASHEVGRCPLQQVGWQHPNGGRALCKQRVSRRDVLWLITGASLTREILGGLVQLFQNAAAASDTGRGDGREGGRWGAVAVDVTAEGVLAYIIPYPTANP